MASFADLHDAGASGKASKHIRLIGRPMHRAPVIGPGQWPRAGVWQGSSTRHTFPVDSCVALPRSTHRPGNWQARPGHAIGPTSQTPPCYAKQLARCGAEALTSNSARAKVRNYAWRPFTSTVAGSRAPYDLPVREFGPGGHCGWS